ncbi:MAG TPA: 50S ribosomal protein L11 methyltransferase [Candidatus Butyricicoccus avicola]|nr:50S ribosomal protein L11 methyltransferase [Candidatus Butyricicoccus avicola]
MDWIEVTIFTSTAGIDPVVGVLEDLGIEGYALEDAADFEEFLQDTEIYWDYVDEKLCEELRGQETKIKVYIADSDEGHAQIDTLNARLAELKAQDADDALGRLTTAQAVTRQEDWEWGWKQYFKPFPVGEQFLIKPSWETVDDPCARRILEIDPASSFGTGTHDTTQMCISMLEKTVKGGEKLLDMGTGSGILAIAAGMLGANPDTAVDIDAHCLTCAQENAARNGVTIARTLHGDALRDPALAREIGGGYDIICANIVADIIIGMAPMFYEKLVPGGTLIASGILAERAEEVSAALMRAGFRLDERAASGGWAAFRASR